MTTEGTHNGAKDRFVRWQAITIAQLGFATNLILTFSVAVLGYEVVLLLNGSLGISSCWLKVGFLLSLAAIIVSIGLGIWLTINRLIDFRETAHIARLRDRKRSSIDIGISRAHNKKLGNRTWRLLYWQIGTFIACIILFSLSVVLPAASRMFDQNVPQLSSQNSKPDQMKNTLKP